MLSVTASLGQFLAPRRRPFLKEESQVNVTAIPHYIVLALLWIAFLVVTVAVGFASSQSPPLPEALRLVLKNTRQRATS